MSSNKKNTSSQIGSLAAKVLNNPNASGIAKELAGSALSQVNKNNQTGAEMEDKAARVLASPKYSEETKSLAASILSQANKSR